MKKKVIQNSCNYSNYEWDLGGIQIAKHCFNLYKDYSEQISYLNSVYKLYYKA